MALLRYLDDAGKLQIKSLDAEHFVIGRVATCDISFDDDMISREHLSIDVETDGRFRIRDLGSRNKTYVNGELITETLLAPGDVIRAGERVFEFVDPATVRGKIDLEFLTPDRTDPPGSEWAKIKAPVSLTIGQLEQLAQIWSDQALMARPEDVADAALGQIILDVQADRGLIALRGESKMDLRPLAHRGLKRTSGGSLTPVSQSFAFAPILQSVAGRYPHTIAKTDAKLGYAATGLVAPLTFRGDVVGILYVDRPTSKKPFPAAALQYCLAAGAQVGSALGESSRRLVRSAAREGAAWMTTIRHIQNSLGCVVSSGDTFEAAMQRYPGRARCGDFGDVVHVDEQRCCAIVVDGGGHGITGVVQACALRTAFRTTVTASEDAVMEPGPIFSELNRMVASSATRQVLPCTYVAIDIAAGKMVYVNAGGMPPLLMVAPGRLVTLDQPSLVLGIDPEYVYEAMRVDLPGAFRVVCHTDGLTEAASGAGEPLGDQRLHEVLLDRDAFVPAPEIVARISQTWTSHLSGAQPDDDALVLAISFR